MFLLFLNAFYTEEDSVYYYNHKLYVWIFKNVDNFFKNVVIYLRRPLSIDPTAALYFQFVYVCVCVCVCEEALISHTSGHTRWGGEAMRGEARDY